MDPDLTLEKAKKMAMQSAAVKEQQSLFEEGDKGNPIVVEEVKKDQRGQKRPWKARKGGDSGDSRKTQKFKCCSKNHSTEDVSVLPIPAFHCTLCTCNT